VDDYGWHARTLAHPGKPVFVDGTRVTTYAEFDERTTRLAEVLSASGVGTEGRVAIMLSNSTTFFEAWGAASKLGAAVVLVNWHLKQDELRYILEDSRAQVLVADPRFEAHYTAAVAASGCRAIVVDDGYESLLASAACAPSERFVAPEVFSAPVFYTSGTTGRPKGVVHGAFDGERARLAQSGQVALWGWTPDDVYLLSGPAYHAGPGGFVMSAIFVGATTVVLPRWDAREWLRLVDRHRVTLSFMTPAHFIRLLEVPEDERARHDLSSLRLIVHGAAPCPVEVKRRIIDALPATEVWELYGASEGGATRISPQEWLERPGSVGLPWPGIEIRILDADGEPRPAGRPGLVYIRPAGGARFHYHDDPQRTDDAWRDDAFTVGDVGYLDADGYLFLTDRATDMVIRGGVNVYPREIEEVVYTHPAVVDCAVFGVPDERLGEQLKLVVETRSPVSAEELQAFLRDRIADYKVPAYVEFVDELPRNPNGKVMKRVLRDEAWAGRDRTIG
jgi:long-chain acyl-CoA synthetase